MDNTTKSSVYTNCVRCLSRPRTGADRKCDECRAADAPTTPAGHTPLPWTFSLGTIGGPDIVGANGHTVGRLYTRSPRVGGELDAGSRANLNLVLSAVNSHADLVAVCKELLGVVRLQNGNLHPEVNDLQERAKAALAKASVTNG